MNVVLDSKNNIRAIRLDSEKYYDFRDVFFYIPKNVNNVKCSLNLTKHYKLAFFEDIRNYFVYRIDTTEGVDISQGIYDLTLVGEDFISNKIQIKLKDLTIKKTRKISTLEVNNIEVYNNKTPEEIQIDNKELVEPFSETIVHGDKNSTIIDFVLNKTYDNESLLSKQFFIRSVNSKGEKHIQFLDPPEDRMDGTISVKWTLDDFTLKEPDNILFSLCANSEVSNYSWQTEISELNVSKGLVVRTSDESNYFDELKQWLLENNLDLDIAMQDEHPILDIIDREIISEDNENTLVQGDNKSQLISFKVSRYQDGVDLSTKIFTIKYVNALGESYRTNAVNIKVEEDYIVFSWLISSNVTAEEGEVNYAIEIIGDLTKDPQDYYIWQTLKSTLTVKRGLGEIINSETPPNWYNDLLNRIQDLNDKIDSIIVSSDINMTIF